MAVAFIVALADMQYRLGLPLGLCCMGTDAGSVTLLVMVIRVGGVGFGVLLAVVMGCDRDAVQAHVVGVVVMHAAM